MEEDVLEKKSPLTYEDRVIRKIASIAANNIEGIIAMSGNLLSGITDKIMNSDSREKGIAVEVGQKQVAVDLKVICEYGISIPEVYEKTVSKITEDIKTMTGLEVVEINMHVDDIMTKEEYERQLKQKETGGSAGPRVD